MEITGPFTTHRSLPSCQSGLNVQFGSPISTSLSLVTDHHACAYLHVCAEQSDCDELNWLTPDWCFSTSSNPVLKLRASKNLEPFGGELALVFNFLGKKTSLSTETLNKARATREPDKKARPVTAPL